MKRCINWFKNLMTRTITNWKEFHWSVKLGIIAGILFGVFLVGILITTCDMTPATLSDFEALENQVTAISQNPDLLFDTDCVINVNDKEIIVQLKNAECELTTTYTKEFEILSIVKKDTYVRWYEVLFLAIIMLMLGCIIGFCGWGILLMLGTILKVVFCKVFQLCKKRYLKNNNT